MLALSNLPASLPSGYSILLVANDGSDPINGTFSSVSGVLGGYAASVN